MVYLKVKCDGCGGTDVRAKGAVAPKGWKYLVTRTTPPGSEIILYACSIACVESISMQWCNGPGVLADVLP